MLSRARVTVTLFVSALTTLLLPTPMAAAERCGPIQLDTLHVHVSATQNIVRAGAKTVIEATVSRHVAHNDVGPAEGVQVLVVVSLGDVTFGDSGSSDADGSAAITVKVPRAAGTGLADVTATATHDPAHCLRESGETTELGLFRVRK